MVFRSALVGVGMKGKQTPVMIVELHDKKYNKETILLNLRQMAKENQLTSTIEHFFIHPGFTIRQERIDRPVF